MKKKSIAMFSLTEIRRDPRVRRIAKTLTNQGHQVTILGIKNSECQTEIEALDGYRVVRITVPQSYSEQDMAGIHRECEALGEQLRTIEPRLFKQNIQVPSWLKIAYQLRSRSPNLFFNIRKILNKSISSGPVQMGKGKEEPVSEFDEVTEILAIRSILLINLELYEVSKKYKPELYHCNDLDTLVAGVIGKITQKRPLIYDAHEIYPEQLPKQSRSETWHQFYSELERVLLPFTDGRMTVCDALGEYFQKHYKSGSFISVKNCPSIELLPTQDILQRRNSPQKILYHGAYFAYRGLEEVIEASPKVDNAIFLFRGFGGLEKTLRQLVEKKGLDQKVKFLDPVPMLDLVPKASECDIGLNPFISYCLNTEYCLPNKLFEYMMAGLAIGNADLIELRQITATVDNGITFDSRDPDQIASGLNLLIKDKDRLEEYRRSSYQAAKEHYNWENQSIRFLKAYEAWIS